MSPSPEHVEYAGTLLRLADADLHACRVLAGHENVADGAVGFHAQQAVEKALKVAIVLAEAEGLDAHARSIAARLNERRDS